MAVGDQRAKVLYRLPDQRSWGAGGFPGLLTVLLAALVLFLGGLLVGRATMTRSPAAGAASATTAAAPGATSPPAQAAEAPGTAAAGQAGAVANTRVGPRQLRHGVGIGYARSQAGAVAAAANYTRVLSSSLILDRQRRQPAIDTLAAPEAEARLQKTFEQAVESLRSGLGISGTADDGTQVLLRATPVGWRVERYEGVGGDSGAATHATVALWVTSVGGSLGGARPVPVQEGWGTAVVELRWVGGDWKLLNSTTTDGPVPIADVTPPTAAGELIDKANQFKEFTYAPGS